MKFKEFLSNTWRKIFLFNGINDFEHIWLLGKTPSSAASLATAHIKLMLPHGGTTSILVKKYLGPPKSGFKKIFPSTNPFANEIKYFWVFKQLRIPTTELVYYNSQTLRNSRCTILITCPLAHFIPLSLMRFHWQQQPVTKHHVKRNILKNLAELLQFLHDKKICHHQLSDAHIYVRYHTISQEGYGERLSIILSELGSTHHCFFKFSAKFHDLSQLFASVPDDSLKDNVRFYQYYCQHARLNLLDKYWLRHILSRSKNMRAMAVESNIDFKNL